jgi:hypothetical protein
MTIQTGAGFLAILALVVGCVEPRHETSGIPVTGLVADVEYAEPWSEVRIAGALREGGWNLTREDAHYYTGSNLQGEKMRAHAIGDRLEGPSTTFRLSWLVPAHEYFNTTGDIDAWLKKQVLENQDRLMEVLQQFENSSGYRNRTEVRWSADYTLT